MIGKDEGCALEIKSRIAMTKAEFKKRRLFLPVNWT